MTNSGNPTGLTTSQGWEIGIRRTFPFSAEKAWETIFSQPVLASWLDDKVNIRFQKNDTYTAASGIAITVTSVTEAKVIRMKWQHENQSHASTLQIRVIPAKEKATISFHHEHLADGKEREEMKIHWENVLNKIASLVF
ncbi:MAG TPA: SRPBCC domain-containing protein [Chitinophaga sp.]|uniref:SRPBCC domain-containing protein n=1 Tax=Chitinophaga sp. TaxID=1869181 RepID=UPI002BE3D698|nr:SRPBCC domain-containing protein [Chitinophaga sp.]HVI43245.1 SRPBCC domain-containing protein [Chitinophaga sp.]